MYTYRKIKDDIYMIGASDRRLALFENLFPLDNGVSYNSYFIDDEKTALADTVDRFVADPFFENLEYLLKGRKGLWLAEDMLLVDGRPFFLLQHQDFGNDAAFAVVDEYGNQAAPDSYDGFTDDVIQQIRQFLQKERYLQL